MQDLSGPPRGPATVRWALWLAGGCGLGMLIVTAWMSDDAYITLRTIDNFWNGYGLRWNAMERVQAYTHPLWLLLIGAAYGLTCEAFLTTIALSFACTIGAVLMLVTRLAPTTPRALVAVACLLGSKAFVEFSTSGLENPLSHLLLAWFCWEIPRDADASASAAHVRRLSLIAALCALTRLDLLTLIAPMLLFVVIRAWRRPGPHVRARATTSLIGHVALGLLPLAAWELFSLIYYGFAFPNTAYAKLATGIPRGELMTQGLAYLRASLIADPITLPAIALAIVWSIARAILRRRDDDARAPGSMPASTDWIVGVSLVSALLYVVFVGGDFMSGRFLSPAFIVAIAWLCRSVPVDAPRPAMAVAATIAVIGAIPPQSPWRAWNSASQPEQLIDYGGAVVDERLAYYAHTGLVPFLLGRGSPAAHVWAVSSAQRRGIPRVQLIETVGLAGYYAGPGAHIIDVMALTDPLLARQPARTAWRVGHFKREPPEGYTATVERCLAIVFPRGRVAPPTDTCVTSPDRLNAIREADAAARYDRLALITQAPLFDPQRLRAIVDINLGASEQVGK